MATFKVLKPVVHDGKAYEPGDSIEAAQEQMVQALAKGYVEPVKAAGSKRS